MTDNQNEWVDPQGIAEVVTDDKGEFEVPVIASGGPRTLTCFSIRSCQCDLD